MTDQLSGLTALLSVVERGSFSAAAAALRVTPSAVSLRVRALEERVGVRLLQRTTRSVGLTEAGERFVARVRPAMQDVEAAFDSLSELRDTPAGTLRLNVPRLAYRQVIAPALAGFLTAYPKIKLDLVIDDGFADIIESGCDAGVRIGEMLEGDMIALRIGGDGTSAVVGSPAYFKARGKPKHPRELAAHECINYRRIARREIYRWEFTDGRKDIEIAVDGRLTANDLDAMMDAALSGIGLMYTLESVVREPIRKGQLVRVLEPYCPPFPGLYLYYPSRKNLAPKLQAFIDFLKARAKGSRQSLRKNRE